MRRFWRGDEDLLSELARRLHGSADIFEASGRAPQASINFVTWHDGFTLRDLVSYGRRHNEPNGEDNRDGHRHNYSSNHGVEGETGDPQIKQFRRRQRLNMLATLLFSKGTPMLLAGDELGNSQSGNNNAYAQDNETGWLDWSGLTVDPGFLHQVQTLIKLRGRLPHTRRTTWPHGFDYNGDGLRDIEWLHPGGGRMQTADWHSESALTVFFPEMADSRPGGQQDTPNGPVAVAILLNATLESKDFTLPQIHGRRLGPGVSQRGVRTPTDRRHELATAAAFHSLCVLYPHRASSRVNLHGYVRKSSLSCRLNISLIWAALSGNVPKAV